MPQKFVIVTASGRRRLVRLSDIREIVSLMALAEVDGRGGSCRGLMNLRGELIPVFDLDGPDARLSPSRVILVATSAEGPLGLIVDDVHDVVTLVDEHVADRPVGGGRASRVARLGDEVLSVMEPGDVVRDEG